MKLVRQTKSVLRALKKDLSGNTELKPIITSFEYSLRNVFDVNSDTKIKWADLRYSKEIWDHFNKALDKQVKLEYDVFPNRGFKVDPKLCFVLMPFDNSFKPVYSKAIKQAVKKARMKAKRADEIFATTPIVQDVWEYINKAALIVADVTDRNPNVFYEVGLAHALPKRLVILTQKKEDVPFDIQHIRWIKYKNDSRGRDELSKKLYRTIKSVMA